MRYKRFFHIKRNVGKFSAVVFALVINQSSLAQFEATDSVKIDTAYTSVSEEVVSEFDRLNPADTIEYKTHFLADSVVSRMKQDEDFWYANQNIAPRKPKDAPDYSPTEPFFLKQWFRTLIWIIIIAGFVAVLIWFLISSDVRLFRKRPSLIRSLSDDALPEDIFSIQYDTELEKALTSKNLRLAVRLMYLHVLSLLADGELIYYKHEKTNSDYLAQLFSTSYYKDFFQLTRHFEYVWYGRFELSETAFAAIRKEYETLKTRLHS